MAKNKLKLNDLKVKSFVTALDTEEQKTTKGGFIYISSLGQLGGRNQWTSQKTRFKQSFRYGNLVKKNLG